MATGTATKTESGGSSSPHKISFACTSDAAGVVTSDPFYFDGEIQSVYTIPSGAPDAPSAYNLQIRRGSATGIDVLGAAGATRSATVEQECTPVDANGNAKFAPVRGDALYLTADTVGNAKKFTAHIYGLQGR